MDSTEDVSRVVDEVEALKAIYGEDSVAFDAVRRTLTIQISDKASLAMIVPQSYPSNSRPVNVTLRTCGLVRSQAAELVTSALEEVHSNHPEYAECIFDYCQLVLIALESQGGVSDQRSNDEAVSTDDRTGDRSSGDSPLAGRIVVHGEPLIDRKSVFQAHGIRVSSAEEAQCFVAYLLDEFPKLRSATHNVMGYKVGGAQDCDDDGEHGAGKGLLFTLQQLNVDNIVVVVSRHFGGTKLGPVRFKHINNVARCLIEQGFST